MKRTTIVDAVCGVLSVTMSGVAAPPEYQQALLDSGPLLYYQLNEDAGNAVNSGSLGPKYDGAYNGAITRGVSTASGDTGVTFNGPADFIQSGALAPAEVIGNPAFSAETVVRIPASATAVNYPPFLHWGGAATGLSVYFSLHFNNNDRVYAGFYNAGLRAAGTIPHDQWLHIVMVREAGGNSLTGTTLYINGVPVPMENDPILCCNGVVPNVTSTTFRINRATDGTRYFTGSMDEIALFDRALPAEEVCAHFLALQLPCAGDATADNQVDVADLIAVIVNWGGSDPDADVNDDGVVDVGDLIAVIQRWGPCPCAG